MSEPSPADSAFAVALRQAIGESGLGLYRIRDRLDAAGTPISVATLSYWQCGRTRPGRRHSLASLASLERVLGVPAGALSGQLGRPLARGRNQGPPSYETLWIEVPEAVAAFGRIDTRYEDHLTRISYHDRVHVGPDRTERSVRTRQVMRSERDGVDRFVVMHGIDDPDCPVSMVGAVSRCTVGRTSADTSSGIVVSEMVLPSPLREPLRVDPRHGLLLVQVDGRPGVIGARWEWGEQCDRVDDDSRPSHLSLT